MLDQLEEKRGLASTKTIEEATQPVRPKTAAVRNSSWGVAPADDLDDLDDN